MEDLLYQCAKSYKELMDYEYYIVLDNPYKELTITFNAHEFMHLSSIQKLKDLMEIQDLSSERILDMILNRKLTFERIQESIYFSKTEIDSYNIEDRLIALKNLHNYLHNMTSKNTSAFRWQRNAPYNERPNNSEINGTLLIVFGDVVEKKHENETVCTFFIEERKNDNVAISIFPTNKSYSNDGRRSVPEYEILSVDELCKTTLKSFNIIKCSDERLLQAKNRFIISSQLYIIKNDLKSLKSKRSVYHNTPTESTCQKYDKQKNIFANSKIYTVEMLSDVITRLNSQLADPHNSEVKEHISEEIAFVQSLIDNFEKNKGKDTHISGISVTQNVQQPDGTLAMKPMVTIKVPSSLTDTTTKVESKAHLISGIISSLVSDSYNFIKKSFRKIKQALSPSPALRSKTHRSISKSQKAAPPKKDSSHDKNVEKSENKPKQEARFSLSDLNSSKYAPRSHTQDKGIEHKNHIDR